MLKKLTKVTALTLSAGVLTLAMSHTVVAAENKSSTANTNPTLSVHFPSPLRADTKSFIDADFYSKSSHYATIYMKRSRGFSKDLIYGVKEGKLRHSVILSYGRTGEVPPGTDIFKHLHNARDLFASKPGHLDLRPQFSHFNEYQGQLHYPFVETMVIFYNPKLIDTKDVPKSWADLANFNDTLAIPGRGCYAVRTLSSLYHTVGEKKFEQIIINANMPKLIRADKDAPKPLKVEGVAKAVAEGKFKVGVGVLTSKKTLQAIADGKLAVIWPKEGAFAFPYTVGVRSNPNEAELDLFNYITKDTDLQKEMVKIGLSSTLRDGAVNPVVEENNFNYKFISIETLMKQDVHQHIIDTVAKHS